MMTQPDYLQRLPAVHFTMSSVAPAGRFLRECDTNESFSMPEACWRLLGAIPGAACDQMVRTISALTWSNGTPTPRITLARHFVANLLNSANGSQAGTYFTKEWGREWTSMPECRRTNGAETSQRGICLAG